MDLLLTVYLNQFIYQNQNQSTQIKKIVRICLFNGAKPLPQLDIKQ